MIARSLKIATYVACAGLLLAGAGLLAFQLAWIVSAAYGVPL